MKKPTLNLYEERGRSEVTGQLLGLNQHLNYMFNIILMYFQEISNCDSMHGRPVCVQNPRAYL